MSRLTVVNPVSLGDVIQAPLSAAEDHSGSFSGGGWVAARPDDVVAAFMKWITVDARGVLLGPHTYGTFVRFWSGASEEVILSDVAGAVEGLRREPGSDIVVFGSSVLLRTLTGHDLVDRYHLLHIR